MMRMNGTLLARRLALGLLAATLLAVCPSFAQAEAIARCGKGWLERVDGLLVLHVEGSPYEMGYQHGKLLKEHVQSNMHFMLDEKAKEVKLEAFGFSVTPEALIGGIVEAQRRHIPAWYSEELRGLADGAEVDLGKAERTNFIPELFHCSGFAIMNSATKDGTLYHGRVLDYAVDWKLQEHAVIVIAKPDDGVEHVNVTFAGFIGSVTGMNAAHISIGEMGGRGLGHWDGVPMAILVKQVLRDAKSLEDALAIFRDQPRTCQYFYVVADGEANTAKGFEASWNVFQTVEVGVPHPLLPRAVKDSVLLSVGDRYNCLVDRVEEKHGKIDAQAALHLMDRGVAMKSNLHNALFAPKSTKFWVTYAGVDKTPAADLPYKAFQLTELLSRSPDANAANLGDVPAQATKTAKK